MTSPFNWKSPSELGKGLQRYSNARKGSSKGVDTRRLNGQDTSTFRGMSKKADRLIAQHQDEGCYFMAEGDKAREAAEKRARNA